MSDSRLEYQRAYREQNRERVRQWHRDFAARHPDEQREKVRQWRLANPEKYRAQKLRQQEAEKRRRQEQGD